MKKLSVVLLFAVAAVLFAQTEEPPTPTVPVWVNTFTVVDANTINMRRITVANLYDTEIRPLVQQHIQQQIAEAIASLPAGGIDQATMMTAIQAAEKRMWSKMVAADANNLRVFEQQRLNDAIAVLQARLAALGQP